MDILLNCLKTEPGWLCLVPPSVSVRICNTSQRCTKPPHGLDCDDIMVKVCSGGANRADVMDCDTQACTVLCCSSLENYLTRLLKNHVAKFTRLLAEKGLGQSWKMPLGHCLPTGEFFLCSLCINEPCTAVFALTNPNISDVAY